MKAAALTYLDIVPVNGRSITLPLLPGHRCLDMEGISALQWQQQTIPRQARTWNTGGSCDEIMVNSETLAFRIDFFTYLCQSSHKRLNWQFITRVRGI